MTESLYNVIEIIGTISESWAEAGKVAVERASKTLRDLRVAEVVEQDIQIKDGEVEVYRVKLRQIRRHGSTLRHNSPHQKPRRRRRGKMTVEPSPVTCSMSLRLCGSRQRHLIGQGARAFPCFVLDCQHLG
jgi:flavin-binding protein dodecin